MAKLASIIDEYVQKAACPVRVAEVADLSKLRSGVDRMVYAVVRYVDQAEYRADEAQMIDKGFRRKFASEAVLALYDDSSLSIARDAAAEKAKAGWCGVLGEISLKVLCPKLFLTDSIVGGERLPTGEGKVEIADKEDLLAIISAMDSTFFTSIYYESVALVEFARAEVERVKNSLRPTSTSLTPQTPQDSVAAGA